MSWDKLKKSKEEQKKGKKYVALKDGDSMVGIFAGEPDVFYQNFKTSEKSEFYKTDFKFRFRIGFVVKEGDSYVKKVFEGSARTRDALLDAVGEYGQKCVFKIKRTGSGIEDTRYSILLQEKIDDARYNKILESVKAEDEKNAEVNNQEDSFPPFDDDLPFA